LLPGLGLYFNLRAFNVEDVTVASAGICGIHSGSKKPLKKFLNYKEASELQGKSQQGLSSVLHIVLFSQVKTNKERVKKKTRRI